MMKLNRKQRREAALRATTEPKKAPAVAPLEQTSAPKPAIGAGALFVIRRRYNAAGEVVNG